MSRKCPKRNHLFLNWLKVSREKFSFSPYILRVHKRSIDFGFHGITSSLKFCQESTATGGPWISVDIVHQGKEREGIVRFYGAEIQTKEGWTSLALRAENVRYWQTKEEVWTAVCLETFLSWCNKNLAKYRLT